MTITELELNVLIKKSLKILRKNYSCPGEDSISYKEIRKDPKLHLLAIKNKFQKIMNGGESFSNPKDIKIMDAHKKERTIYVYNIYDRIIQQCIKLIISDIVESNISERVLSHKAGLELDKKINDFLFTHNNAEPVLKLDIKNYFSSINKEILFKMLLEIGVSDSLISLIKASFCHCETGIPTGNCLSPILSDLYLTPIDSLFNFNYVRFSDDMFFALKAEDEVNNIIDRITPSLIYLQLEINKYKSQIIKHRNIKDIL